MSVSTVKRAIKTLKEYGMIEAIPTIKKWTGRGKSRRKSVNIIVIQSQLVLQYGPTTEDGEVATGQADKYEDQSESINPKHNSVTYSNTYQVDPSTPYRRFKAAVQTFIGNGKQYVISRLYGVYLAQTKTLRKAYGEDNELMDVAVQAIQQTFMATKRKRLRNVAGYFNGTLSNMLDRMGSDLMAQLFV